MSWDSTETKRPCPCGKGTFTIVDRSDDWGRSESHWKMDCPDCRKRYSLYTYGFYRSGLYEECHRWINKGKYDEARKLQEESKRTQKIAVELSVERHLSALMTLFDAMSKKAIWETLSKHIKPFKSLGTFYQHTKGKEKYEYLKELFYFSNLRALLQTAEADDGEIKELIEKSELLESRAKSLLHE